MLEIEGILAVAIFSITQENLLLFRIMRLTAAIAEQILQSC